ncbi:MAG: alpha/beta hydrolase [Acidobacteria bacterium]|nr:alpha/beta hydrolase [Acidobacteriota bacterium]
MAFLMFASPQETERFPVGTGRVLVWRTHSLSEGSHADVERAYIMIHGTNRNAEEYFRWALASTVAANQMARTAVVAPHFKARTRDGRGDEVEKGEWFWTNEAWKAGETALNGAVNSFDLMDRLFESFNDPMRFPNLKEVVLAGHSAGGQYVQRYAALNNAEPKMRVPVRYVVANPSSYVYLNDLRLRSGAVCSEKGGCTGPFVKYWDAPNCTAFNHYRYGLDNLTGYAASAQPTAIREQFPKRRVTYLVGELDVRPDDPSLDRSCPAVAQGPNRRERGVTFWNYMKLQFGATHEFAIAPGCGHAAVCVFAGPAGVKAVFGAPGN